MRERIARFAFIATLLVVLAATLGPTDTPGAHSADKAAHFLSFFELALLGVVAWGRKALPLLAAALPILGASIELLQGTDLIGRDADLLDWLADTAGVAAILTPLAFFQRPRNISADRIARTGEATEPTRPADR